MLLCTIYVGVYQVLVTDNVEAVGMLPGMGVEPGSDLVDVLTASESETRDDDSEANQNEDRSSEVLQDSEGNSSYMNESVIEALRV